MVMAVLMALRCVTSGVVTQTNALLTLSSLSLLYLHGSRLFHFGVFIKLILKCFWMGSGYKKAVTNSTNAVTWSKKLNCTPRGSGVDGGGFISARRWMWDLDVKIFLCGRRIFLYAVNMQEICWCLVWARPSSPFRTFRVWASFNEGRVDLKEESC